MAAPTSSRVTLRSLRHWVKDGRKFAMLTCYDATTAGWLWRGGVETLLVGDTAAQFILGHDSTLPAPVDFMVEITAAVRRGAPDAFIMAALVPVMLAGSLRLSDIALAQQGLWFVFYPVLGQLGFIAYIVASVAAENRVPFDILEAESELVAGFRVEYSGMKFAIIQLGEYAHVLGTSFLGALLFLGAWSGPGPWWLGPVWFLIKALMIFLLITWVRWSFIRIRVDQILQISWKLLLPITVLLVMATAVTIVVRSGAGG